MNYFYVYIFILSITILYVSYVKTTTIIEQMTLEKKYILLGDSILNNNQYVPTGKSVEDYLSERKGLSIISFAKDNSVLNDIFNQIDKIPYYLDNSNTYIILSIGGNNIISYFVNNPTNTDYDKTLQNMFKTYNSIIESISIKMPNSNIILLDVYYPTSIKYKKYYTIIQKWNDMLYHQYSYKVLKISEYLTEDNDFIYDIEPSVNGGNKIANLLLSFNM